MKPGLEIGTIIGLFDAKYIGSVPVKHSTGNDICADAVTRVRALKQPAKEVHLAVTTMGVYVVDVKTGDIVKEAPINEVTFVSMDASDKKLISYITTQKALGLIVCHTFQVKQRGQDIPIAINQSFQVMAGKLDVNDIKGVVKVSKEEALKQSKDLQKKEVKKKRPTADCVGQWDAKFMGTVHVNHATGDDVITDAIDRVKLLNHALLPINMLLFQNELEFYDASTEDTIKTVPIGDITYPAQDPKNARVVALITCDSRLGLKYCHVFTMQEKTAGAEFLGRIKQLAQVEEAQRRKSKDGNALLQDDASERKTGEVLGAFEAKLLGVVPVTEKKGTSVVDKAVEEVKSMNSAEQGVVLLISSEGIRMVDGLTSELLRSIFIKQLSFTTVAGPQNTYFAFIAHDDRLQRTTCHIFHAGAQAYDICSTVGKAFQICGEEMKARNENPFAALPGESREQIDGPLKLKQIHRTDLKAGDAIGAGQFGQVFLASFAPQGRPPLRVAVKMLRGGASADDKSEFLREAETMVSFEHINLVRMLGVAVQQRPWLCVIEYMLYGDMRDVLQTCKERRISLTYLEQLVLAQHISSGMEYLASKALVHIDLAARNVLLTAGSLAKVADFGLTRSITPGQDHFKMTGVAKLPLKWMSIEAMDQKIFSEQSDVWSFGVVLWEIMAYGSMPYEDVKNAEIQKRVREGLRLPKVPGAADSFYDVASSCWAPRREGRPSFAALTERLSSLKASQAVICPEPRDIGQIASKSK